MPICGLVCILAERLRVSLLADPTLGILAASQAIRYPPHPHPHPLCTTPLD